MSRTAGEQLLGRDLRAERRAGVPHYSTGQHRAERDPKERGVFLLGYVDVLGHAVLMIVLRLESLDAEMRSAIPDDRAARAQEGWLPVLATRAGQGSVEGTREVRETFRLSEDMLTALTAASLRGET